MTTDTPYRWSPEVERQFLALVSVGCSAGIIAEQIGCSERMARRLVMRWKAGLALNMEPPRVGKVALVPPKPRPGRPGRSWLATIMDLSPEEREPWRLRVIEKAKAGQSVDRISNAVKVPKAAVLEWIAEWRSSAEVEAEPVADEDGEVEEAPRLPPVRPGHVWPRVTMREGDWPADARFEDEPRACRPEPRWLPSRTISDRASYISNATAWCSA